MSEKKTLDITPFLIILVVILSFLAGSFYMKAKTAEKEKTSSSATTGQAGNLQKPFNPPKKEKPEVKFFVMSFCPYGNQAEAGLMPVAKLLKDKVLWQPVYIVSDAKQNCEWQCQGSVYDENRCQQLVSQKRVPDMATCRKYFPYKDVETCLKEKCAKIKEGEFSSLHGEQELNQDIREICAWNMGEPEKWWSFVDKVNNNCDSNNVDSCWESYAKEAGFDTQEIKKCQKERGKDLLKQQIEITNKYGVSGSPTVYINDTLYNGGRQPEDYKKAICLAFEKEPEECKTVLSETTTAPAAGGCQ